MPSLPPFAEKATHLLHATERAVPYNNVSNLYVLNGQRPNPRFGGDCLYQAKLFGERIVSMIDNVPVRFHNQEGDGTRGHIVPIVGDGDERLAFEITALGAEPIPLAACRGRANELQIPTFPLPPAGDRRISAMWLPHMEQLHLRMVSACQGGMLWHRIATDPPIAMPDTWHPIDDYMTRQPRRPLRMHLLEEDFGKTTLSMDPVDGAMTAQHVGAEPVQSGSKMFQSEMARIAEALGVTRMQLLEFFHEGRWMERELQGLD